mmetsp:Transcript_15988/g.43100  ORF Transcript_15988/g.43100 Transcript_15988/m.43100 type:complete len:354 (+) Transcript_15988:99-1160(+)
MIDVAKHASVDSLASVSSLLVLILGASVVVFVSAAVECGLNGPCDGLTGFALGAGATGSLLAGGYLAAKHFAGESTAHHMALAPLTITLGIGWLASAVVLTSAGPFHAVGNGYVSSWTAAVASLRAAHLASARLRELFARAVDTYEHTLGASSVPLSATALIAASAVELVAASLSCAAASPAHPWCSGYVAFGVAAGTVSIFTVLLFLVVPTMRGLPEDVARRAQPSLAVFLCAWWLVSAPVLTFVEPFKLASNGFFASHAAALAAMQLAHDTWVKDHRAAPHVKEQASSRGPEAPPTTAGHPAPTTASSSVGGGDDGASAAVPARAGHDVYSSAEGNGVDGYDNAPRSPENV